jgi:hypothetical protein
MSYFFLKQSGYYFLELFLVLTVEYVMSAFFHSGDTICGILEEFIFILYSISFSSCVNVSHSEVLHYKLLLIGAILFCFTPNSLVFLVIVPAAIHGMPFNLHMPPFDYTV